MSLVKRKVGDRRVLWLIDSYLKAGILEGGVTTARVEGTPQGGPLSPLLSNILLDELDKELESEVIPSAVTPTTATSTLRRGQAVNGSWPRSASTCPSGSSSRSTKPKARLTGRGTGRFWVTRMTWHRKPRLTVAKKAVARLKATLRTIFRRGRGRASKHHRRNDSEAEGMGKLLPVRGGKRHLRGTGRMAEAETASYSLAAVEAPLYPSKEPDAAGIIGGDCMAIGHKRPRPLVECRGRAHEQGFPKSYFDKLGLVSLMNQYHRLQHTS